MPEAPDKVEGLSPRGREPSCYKIGRQSSPWLHCFSVSLNSITAVDSIVQNCAAGGARTALSCAQSHFFSMGTEICANNDLFQKLTTT